MSVALYLAVAARITFILSKMSCERFIYTQGCNEKICYEMRYEDSNNNCHIRHIYIKGWYLEVTIDHFRLTRRLPTSPTE